MKTMNVMAAGTSWPDAIIVIAGIGLVAIVAVAIIWQALATWRTRMTVVRAAPYRELAEKTAQELTEIRERLDELHPTGGSRR